jgi:hypothetical protein
VVIAENEKGATFLRVMAKAYVAYCWFVRWC